ncbi:MAG TPA: hypothetical protein VK824_09975 [Planctomycetota bacterium]|nr:hypothetical protein [Planctomycetota bacterium]
MRVNPDFLRGLDPRKSYDRGPMALPDAVRPHAAAPDGAATAALDVSRIAEHLLNDSNWTRRAMSDSISDLSSLSIEELKRELKRREDAVGRLQERRARVVAELAALEAEIRAAGGTVTGAGAGEGEPGRARTTVRVVTPRPKNTLNLADALTAAIEAGAVVSPTEAADLVKRAGYLTNSKTFVQTVTVALSRHSGFRRVERGRYECIR